MANHGIVEHYEKYFRTVSADTDELRYLVYKLRYEVYCKEFGYEEPETFPDYREMDFYDDYSKHCLLFHKISGKVIGSLRLIVSEKGKPILPIELHCTSLDQDKFNFKKLREKRIGEFSRLAVLSEFRRRRSDDFLPGGSDLNQADISEVNERRSSYPAILVSLCLAGLVMILESQSDYGVAMMEPRLVALLDRYGIASKRIGGLMDYHGTRGPYELLFKRTLSQLDEAGRALAQAIANDMGSSFAETMEIALAQTSPAV